MTGRSLALLALLWPAALAAADDWPMSRRDARNLASIELPGGAVPRAWRFEGSGRVWTYRPGQTLWSSPALAEVEGRALLVLGGYDRSVYALDAATGEVRWRFTAGAPVQAAPVIWRDGDQTWVFFAADDRLVYALDAVSGRQRWVHAVEDWRPTLGGAQLSAPCVAEVEGEPRVFVGDWVWDRSLGAGLQRSAVTALGARDGKPRWRQVLGDNVLTAPIHAEVDGKGRLFVGSSDGNVHALDAASGALLWRHTELDAVRAPPAFAHLGGRPLIFSASKYGAVRALDARTGAEVWAHKTGDRITAAPVLVELAGRLTVLVGSYDRRLWALDAENGQVRWTHALRAGIYGSAAAAPGADPPLAVVPAWDHALHAVALADGAPIFTRFTGRPLWEVAGLDESSWSSPILARVGGRWMAYAAGYDGAVRALPVDEAVRLTPARRSNLAFWLSFPMTLGFTGLLAWVLTRRARGRAGGRPGGAR